MLGRRSFLKAIAQAPLLVTIPKSNDDIIPDKVIPNDYDYYIDFDLVKSCDMYFDELEKDARHFQLEIYDATNQRNYEGYIQWWVLISEDVPREKAIARGYAQVVDGIVTVDLST